jgi:hypothetical protein
MKCVTVLAVFQFTRDKKVASRPRSAGRALSSLPACVARQPPEADLSPVWSAPWHTPRPRDGRVPREVPFLTILIRRKLMIGQQMPP